MVNVDLLFHYGGEWKIIPKVLYKRKLVHTWKQYDSDLLSFIDLVNEYTSSTIGYIGVQQLIVSGPSGRFYEILGDDGIRTLQNMVSEHFNIINVFAVEDSEMGVPVPNIVDHNESQKVDCEVATDCSSNESEDNTLFSDYDSDDLEVIALQKNRDMSEKLTEYKELYKGMTFKDIPEARKVMNLYCLANCYGLKQLKSDSIRLRYRCEVGCPFVCLISEDKKGGGVKIKTLKSKHKCNPAYDNPRIDKNTIAEYFKNKLQENPMIKVKEMKSTLKSTFNINVSHAKCKRAKRMILESLAGSFTDEYNKIEAYANELRLSNPGSDVVVTLSKDALAEGKRRFSRMYICFHALKMGFKSGLRPFIGLDGTFLKGKAKGQLLVAVALDSMNHFYPIAWAVVDKETKVTWTWFLTLLNNSLDLKLGEGYTFMSDMQKGLIEAVQAVVPDAHHRYCVRHIEANWCRRWGAGDLKKKYLWWCAWSSYEEEFKDQLKNLGEVDEKAAEDLLRYPPQSWCRAYFDTVCKNQQVDNNLTESFNSWILEARHKPIIRILEDIRVKVMNMLREHESEVQTWTEDVSPHTMKLYYQFLNSAQKCTVDSNGQDGYEVNEGTSEKHRVNINQKKCTCRTWDLTGIPCPHAIRALLYKKMNPVSEIHWWFTKEAYLSTYAHKLEPIRGEKFWNIEPSHAMDPPQLVNMAGRPKVKRTREKNETINRQGEWSQSRKGRVMTCSTCGQPGHNVRGCQKQSKGKQPQVGKKTKKRSRTTIEEDHEQNMARSPAAAGLSLEEELQLTAPQASQASQASSNSGPQFMFMPTPSLSRNQSFSNEEPDFDYPAAADNPDPPIMPRRVSEAKTRLQRREQLGTTTGTRTINFVGDASGVSLPTELPYSPKNLTWRGKAAITGNQLERQRLAKMKSRKGNGNTQK